MRRPLPALLPTLLPALLALAACAPAARPDPGPPAAAGAALPRPAVRAEVAPARPVPRPAVAAERSRRRPPGAPDVVILGFAGHCGPLCRTRDTWAYLDKTGEGPDEAVETLQAVRDAFRAQGREVHYLGVSSFVEAHESARSGAEEPGYLEAQAYLDFVRETWIEPYPDDPARVVLVAHSHGAVWATLLAMNNLDVTFDYLVSLDAVCWQWWRKHRPFVRRAFEARGEAPPFPLDQGDPCGALRIPGHGRQDITDVVPANVIVGLEARTPWRPVGLEPNLVRDDAPNVRINGSRLGVWSVEAAADHRSVPRRDSGAMAWVAQMIAALGLPDHDAWRMEDAVLPPPPEGWRYR